MSLKGILVVDDNDHKRRDLLKMMQMLGITKNIHSFCYADELLYFVRERMPDEESQDWLIMLDMQMPREAGGRISGGRILADCGSLVMDTLWDLKKKCPVIVVSSEKIDEKRARLLYKHYLGCVEYEAYLLSKLYSEIRNLLIKNGYLFVDDE